MKSMLFAIPIVAFRECETCKRKDQKTFVQCLLLLNFKHKGLYIHASVENSYVYCKVSRNQTTYLCLHGFAIIRT